MNERKEEKGEYSKLTNGAKRISEEGNMSRALRIKQKYYWSSANK
jgi:hypothetical protein